MPKANDLIPSIKICVHCPHLCFDSIEVRDVNDGHVQDFQPYWVCSKISNKANDTLFFDDSHKPSGNIGIIELETKKLPLECPYVLEQLYSQDTAGQERWVDLLPMLKAKALSQQV